MTILFFVLISKVAFPQTEGGNIPDTVPQGPYSSWPADIRHVVAKRVIFHCTIVGIMDMGNYRGSNQAAKEKSQATLYACATHQMPPDWPDREEALKREAAAFSKAKTLDPNLSDPLIAFPPS